ncbi:RECEPTOR-LIKE SERINE/THREONINE-PROTEIN KINASE NCRK ISOFORM X1 [Salix purpurea]|uniref:RECEPTOR-LIKE SERINE/THREONINE-PROTEIN KINASE NCRK ISOFORM X1 n=1 Tax=Salix purpurea TaxID=77065 RepID=A0A9Q0SVS3_SALPP|nr:RECEPTOR-LIKE SERINE/THREONINE-PROTEIN KINASE NCRK ISOFORM X1 [Salix purpurea]
MREVVQILSTIAPEKSKRRNIPVNLFQMSSIQGMKMEPYKEKPGGRAEGSIDAEEALKRDKSIQQSALDVEHDLFGGSNNVGADDISTFLLERLIHMTSKAQSRRASDDEAVDVTEPRLESFCMVPFEVWRYNFWLHADRRHMELPQREEDTITLQKYCPSSSLPNGSTTTTTTAAAIYCSHCLIHHTMKEDGWIHVYGFCVAVAYSHAAALHSLSLCHLLPKAAFL